MTSLDYIYKLSTLVIGVQCLVMTMTIWIQGVSRKNIKKAGTQSVIFFSLAIFGMSVINLMEFALNNQTEINKQLAIVISAASIELFLFMFSYLAILDKRYISGKKIIRELILITIFTVPPILVNNNENPKLFTILFYIALLFYVVRLILNIVCYKKYLTKAIEKLHNYYSEDGYNILRWVNNSFFIVLTIAVISTIVPITNMKVLLAYNIFIGLAYMYLYALIIRNIFTLFKKMNYIELLDGEDIDGVYEIENNKQTDPENLKTEKYISQNMYQEWINKRMYTQMGITAEDTAAVFCINKSKLSQYLKYELNTNYYQWIAKLRIEDAKKQLIEFPEKLISDIAIDVGIEDKSNFTRTFKKFTGISPQTYRSLNTR